MFGKRKDKRIFKNRVAKKLHPPALVKASTRQIETTTGGVVPDTFDVSFIERQIAKIGKSTSMLDVYFSTLKTKFTNSAQIKLLEGMADYNHALATGVGSQESLTEAKIKYEEAKQKFEIFKKDSPKAVDHELDMNEITRENELLDQKIIRAEKLKKLHELEQPTEKRSNDSTDDPDTIDADFEIFDSDK